MTKKDYVQIAAAIKSGLPIKNGEATAASVHEQITLAMARSLKADNPRFNFDIFMRACGYDNYTTSY